MRIFIIMLIFIVLLKAQPALAASDIEELKSIISGSKWNKTPAKNIPEFLRRLHKQREMPEGFLAVYKSNALNAWNVSRDKPRILLTWKNSVLAFNGVENKIEMITFEENSKKFELYKYDFDPGKSQNFVRNPAECMTCHANKTKDPIPIYDGYNTWPGYYGTNDGQIQGKEWADYHAFKTHYGIFDAQNQANAPQKSESVYSYLIDWSQSKKFMYSDPNGKRELDHYKPADCDPKVLGPVQDQKTAGSNQEDIRYRFVDFGKFLFSKQQKYIIQHRIMGTDLEPYRYAILGAVLCGSEDFDEESFLPVSSKPLHSNYQQLMDDTRDRAARSYSHKVNGVYRDLGFGKDFNNRTDPALDRQGKPRPEGITQFEQDLRRLEGFRALQGGRTGPFSVGYKGSTEPFGIYARVRFIIENFSKQKMDWSMSRKAAKSEYKDEDEWAKIHHTNTRETMRYWPSMQRIEKYWKTPEADQVSGPYDFNLGEGCFDFERPEYWRALLMTEKGSSNDRQEDADLLAMLDKAMINIRADIKGDKETQAKLVTMFEKYGGYQLSSERQTFCKALQKRSWKELGNLK